jgi:hypothetical protein
MLKVKKINMVAMVTEIAIYLHFTREKNNIQCIGIEKAIFHEFFYYIYHLNMIYSNLQHKYVYLKQISDIFIK